MIKNRMSDEASQGLIRMLLNPPDYESKGFSIEEKDSKGWVLLEDLSLKSGPFFKAFKKERQRGPGRSASENKRYFEARRSEFLNIPQIQGRKRNTGGGLKIRKGPRKKVGVVSAYRLNTNASTWRWLYIKAYEEGFLQEFLDSKYKRDLYEKVEIPFLKKFARLWSLVPSEKDLDDARGLAESNPSFFFDYLSNPVKFQAKVSFANHHLKRALGDFDAVIDFVVAAGAYNRLITLLADYPLGEMADMSTREFGTLKVQEALLKVACGNLQASLRRKGELEKRVLEAREKRKKQEVVAEKSAL